jgi:hypothetical protein
MIVALMAVVVAFEVAVAVSVLLSIAAGAVPTTTYEMASSGCCSGSCNSF